MKERRLGDMPAEEFRRLVCETAEWMADFLARAGERPVLPSVVPGAVAAALPAQPPDHGEEMPAILADFQRLIFPALTQWNHPAFLGYFATTASGPGILGEMLAASINTNAMMWSTSPGATELEQVVLDWLWQLVGLPDHCFGMIHDTASTSTLHAVAAAREALEDLAIRTRGQSGAPPLMLYTSTHAHSSVEKAAIALGIGQDNVRKIEVDDEFRMKPEALDAAISVDLLAHCRPFCVVATVGTTSTTSIDPVPKIAEICRRRRLWLHVDAAYGGAAAIVPEMSHVLAGCDLADSLVINPHKWLFTPQDLSAFYCRRPEILRRAFSLVPEYLHSGRDARALNFMEYGVPLGRRFRALKLWFVIRYFGREGLVANLREHLRLAREFGARIQEHPDFELMAPVVFSTVCFRFRPQRISETQLQRLNRSLLEAVNRTGQLFLSNTVLHDKFVLRLAIGNLRTTQQHIEKAWELIRSKARELTL
ncbi:MAG TPA: pyridoxal-dependent decarboxylase [Bryobacterales bacterium]|jgi:aromatic-L-amino-acid decarboxylase|nr:pyridoxal-dependent decarboxylase [Bryobacterales bacterium]